MNNGVVNGFMNFYNGQGLIIQIFIIVLLTAIVHFFVTLAFKRLKVRAEKTHTTWDEALVKAVNAPAAALIWFLGISYAIDIFRSHGDNPAIFNAIGPLREIAVIGLIVWFVFRLIKQLEWGYLNPKGDVQRKADATTVAAIAQILRAAVFITAVLVAMQTFGFNISGLLTLGGVGGIVIGFAAKDMLANFFGGLMIYFDKPFKVGDWVRSPDRNIEGTVEQIGWRLTRIRTFDKRPLYVPNMIFSTISVENPSRMLNRRIKTNIGVRYDDATKIGVIVADVKKMLQEHPEIDTDATLIVNLVEFGASALSFMVYTFTKTTNWIKFQEIQQDVFLKIIEIISSHGAECAFPTTTVHVPEGLNLNSPNPTQTHSLTAEIN